MLNALGRGTRLTHYKTVKNKEFTVLFGFLTETNLSGVETNRCCSLLKTPVFIGAGNSANLITLLSLLFFS
jgi:hypothetical protein